MYKFIPELQSIMGDIADEVRRASSMHKPLNSAHEAYAVIAEEMDEFWDEVKKKSENRDKAHMREELIQVAAMAIRTMIDLDLREAA